MHFLSTNSQENKMNIQVLFRLNSALHFIHLQVAVGQVHVCQRFLVQNSASFCKIWIITLVFKENTNVFRKNWQTR
jgi:hypothetical protein